MKEEALKLADELNQIDEVDYADLMVIEKGISMIRRLVEELDTTEKAYKWTEMAKNAPTKPLSFDVMVELGKEVDAVWDVNINGSVWFPSVDAFESFCKAIEERHGIK
jgi:hypothetical protein